MLNNTALEQLLQQAMIGRSMSVPLAMGMTLAYREDQQRRGLELAVSRAEQSPKLLRAMLERRFRDMAVYENCFPCTNDKGDWLVWFPLPTTDQGSQYSQLAQGAEQLLALVGLDSLR
ncbi:hypothetical protein QCD60_24425 [Pokkaliibacter sp. MBI-7]|uniref:hypothetical protein n=1 Tax=Pokkaliibacter sp. MBI-7 TaxID=3040600 RepID=UPI00244C520B|nr:hypothetical protein [Pokkaliibacter sp. MBI-7]MDH2435676.1 hypothetical protein [Pokkaliibacter sp. MBI-7]